MKRTKDSLPLGAAAAAATAPRSSSAVAGSRAPAAAASRSNRGPVRIDELLRDPQRDPQLDPLGELMQLATLAAHIDRATAIFERLREKVGPARSCELAYALGRARMAIDLALQELEADAGIVGGKRA